ncbi:MAG TPA: DUF3943 domain-containing protein [Bacteroidota bacterium]|jgi:hypothetical protein
MKHTSHLGISLSLFFAAAACVAQNGSTQGGLSPLYVAGSVANQLTSPQRQLSFGLGWSPGSHLQSPRIPMPDSVPPKTDTVPSKTDSLPQHTEGVSTKTAKVSYRDSTVSNIYGDLLDDDPEANPKSPLWVPIAGFIRGNVFTWAVDRYVSNADYARVGFQSWKTNIQTGWEWDSDGFEMNHFFHPYGGAMAFIGGRSNGYGYFESLPFAFGSSLMWEYFGENSLPSYNDLINTTLSGAFGGEILYRLSSNVLDDRATGAGRFFRELLAAVFSPTRAFNRFTEGRLFRASADEVYQKEPLNVTFSLGAHNVNDGSKFGTGSSSVMANAMFVYGNPFENRSRKPFDFFKLRFDLNFGVGNRVIDNIIGYGLLFGSNGQAGPLKIMAGGFQHYDYWDNNIYRVSSLGFGGGIISQLPILTKSVIESAVHLAVIPLAAISSPYVSIGDRDYAFGGGLQAKLENIVNLGWGSLTTDYFVYWIHTYVGAAGDNLVGIFKPRLGIQLYRNVSVGFEYLVYQRKGNFDKYPDFYSLHTEQKVYVILNLENFGITE